MHEYEVQRIVKLVARMNAAFDTMMPTGEDRPLWNAATHLILSAYSGQVVTITSLSSVTGLPYATSRRFIQSMISQGLITRSARSRSGKTYSLHASDSLKVAFERYAKEIKTVLAEVVGARGSCGDEGEYYFGAPRAPQYSPPMSLSRADDPRRKLNFLVNDDGYFAALQNMWTDFRSNLGSRSNFSVRTCSEVRAELIENSKRPVSSYDIVSVNLPWLGGLVENDVLQPIADLLDQSRFASSVADADLKQLGQWNGQVYGVPIYCSVNIFAARSDLFGAAGLKYPKTFDEVIARGRALSSSGRVAHGIVWDAARGTPIATTFMALLAAAGGSPLTARGARNALVPPSLAEEDLAEIIVSDGARCTLGYMRQLVEISPPSILSLAWNDAFDVFMLGDAAMCYSWSMRSIRGEYEPRSAVKRRVTYLSQPVGFGGTRASPLSGFLLAVPKNLPEDRARLAIEAIGWLISTESGAPQTSHSLPIAPRFALAADPELKATSRVVGFLQELARKGLLHTQHRPATARFSRIEEILGEEVHDALTGGKTDRQALDAAALRIAELARRPLSTGLRVGFRRVSATPDQNGHTPACGTAAPALNSKLQDDGSFVVRGSPA